MAELELQEAGARPQPPAFGSPGVTCGDPVMQGQATTMLCRACARTCWRRVPGCCVARLSPHPRPPHLSGVLLTAPLCSQVFGDGPDAVKQSLEGVFDDAAPDGKVKLKVPFR